MPKSALKGTFLQWHFLRFNFEKLTTFKITIRNKLLRNSSWIRLCLGLPLFHHVIFISNIIWDHIVDIFCVLIFPCLFKWAFATFVFGVHSFVCVAGEQPFVSNCQGFNCVVLPFLLRKKHELQMDQKGKLTFLDLFTWQKWDQSERLFSMLDES